MERKEMSHERTPKGGLYATQISILFNFCDYWFWSAKHYDTVQYYLRWSMLKISTGQGICHVDICISIILWISTSDRKRRDTQWRGTRVAQICQWSSAINCSDRCSRREKERHAAEKNVEPSGVACFLDIHLSVNSCDQLFWSEQQRGEEMISEKEGLKTSTSITSVNSCNEFLRPADRRGGKRDKQRERSPEGEICTLDIYISTNSFDY